MDVSLYQKINNLPEELQKKVEEFVDSLKNKHDQQSRKPKRKLGLAKGKIEILPSFDDPVPGMEEYTR